MVVEMELAVVVELVVAVVVVVVVVVVFSFFRRCHAHHGPWQKGPLWLEALVVLSLLGGLCWSVRPRVPRRSRVSTNAL